VRARRIAIDARLAARVTSRELLPDPRQTTLARKLESLAGRLAAVPLPVAQSRGYGKTTGLYVHGGIGCGKTLALDMFHARCLELGVPCRRTHFHEFILDVHVQYHEARKRGSAKGLYEEVASGLAATSPVFAFDECHVLNVSDAMIMKSVMSSLFDAGCVVVATSNLSPKALYASGLNREVFAPFLSTLEEHCEVFAMAGAGETSEDYRSLGAAKAPKGSGYFAGADSEACLNRYLSECSMDVVETRTLSLPLGRSLVVNSRSRDGFSAADLAFDEACGRPVGVPEYLAIAEQFDCLLLRSVPEFEEGDEDAARRFVILVDICYDRKKSMLISSDFAPENVFQRLKEKYGHDVLAGSEAMGMDGEDDLGSTIRVPTFGGGSGKHVSQFRAPGALSYTPSGRYESRAGSREYAAAADSNTILTAGPGRPQDKIGVEDPSVVMAGTVEESTEWVEWSATGLKDASMFDLTGNQNAAQQKDRLLPLLRCESRLKEMRKNAASLVS
jgi:cell division protein ZapE